MPAHEADADLEILLDRLFAEFKHLLRRGAVGRERLLHEDVETLLDGVGEMGCAEGQRRGQDHDVAGLEAVHRVFVRIEANELAVGGHVHRLGDVAVVLHRFEAGVEPILEGVGHGDELDGAALGIDGVEDGAGAASAAADDGHLDSAGFGGVYERNRYAGQGWRRRRQRRPS